MKSRILLVLMICVIAMSVFATGGRENVAAGSREVSLCMSQIRYGYSVDDSMMRAWVGEIEKATNTKITIRALPHNDFNQQLNVLFASGDLPDIIRPQQSWDVVSQYAVRGYLQPVTSYINNDPRFAQLKNEDLTMYSSGRDIYGIPTDNGNVKVIWFRQDMINKYNLNIKNTMTTTEFVTELRKVNKNEAIPFTFPRFVVNFQLFYNFFGAYGGIVPDRNGNYHDGINTPEMRQALTWVKSLYDEGLMDREFITNENTHIREKLSTGRAVSDIDYTSRYAYYVETAQGVGAPTEFIPVYTLVGPNGGRGNLNESGGEAMCLSSRNRDVAASMDIIHWLFFTPEGRKLDALSVEGVHYDVVNRTHVARPAAVTAGYAIEYQRLSASWANVPFASLGFSFTTITDNTLNNMLNYINISKQPDHIGPLIRIPMGISPLYDENVASYNENLYEMATKVVLGTQTIDAAFADYARFWNSIRGDEMLRQINAARR